MNRQFPFWLGKGEGFGRFARLMFTIFLGRFLGLELRLLSTGEL